MVTTFSARLLNLANICNPIVGGTKRKYNIMSAPPSKGQTTTKRAQSSPLNGFHGRRQGEAQDDASNKRRRQKEELKYRAATVREALADAGRPPVSFYARRRERALPPGSVDMELARVVTSREYDDSENGEGAAKEEGNDYDVSHMRMVAGLLQSTRHCYAFSGDEATANVSNGSPRKGMPGRNRTGMASQAYNGNCNDEKLSEDNSEGLSSWTPSSYCNGLEDEDKLKSIDNDNRSDGQFSDAGAGSESSDAISFSDDQDVPSSSPKAKDGEQQQGLVGIEEPSFSIIG